MFLLGCASPYAVEQNRMRAFERTRIPDVHFENATPGEVATYFGAIAIWGPDTNAWWIGSSWPVLAVKGTNHLDWVNTPCINYSATNIRAGNALDALSKSTDFEFRANGWGMIQIEEKIAQQPDACD